MTQTDITLTAVVIVLLAEIAEQLTTAADAVIGGISDHRTDALPELFLTIFVDGRWELDILHILTPLGVADIGRLFLWDEMQDMSGYVVH